MRFLYLSHMRTTNAQMSLPIWQVSSELIFVAHKHKDKMLFKDQPHFRPPALLFLCTCMFKEKPYAYAISTKFLRTGSINYYFLELVSRHQSNSPALMEVCWSLDL